MGIDGKRDHVSLCTAVNFPLWTMFSISLVRKMLTSSVTFGFTHFEDRKWKDCKSPLGLEDTANIIMTGEQVFLC